jgi:hypothetical protein
MTVTALVVTTLLIVAGLYDLGAVVVGRLRGDPVKYSISRFMQWLPRNATFFVCVVFYVLGHVFGFMNCPECPPIQNPQPVLKQTEFDNPAGMKED